MDTLTEILKIAQTISPLGVIFLLVVVIYQLVGGKNVIDRIRGTQKEKYPQLETGHEAIQKHLSHIENLYSENKKFQENHSMHEIPEIKNAVVRIEASLVKISDKQVEQGIDIARLKALSEN